MDSQAERHRLESIAQHSLYAHGASGLSVRHSYSIVERFLRDGSILELGAAEGVMTNYLARRGQPLTIVEGSGRFCADLRARFPQCEVVHALFEEFEPGRAFDNIVLGHVLEHVDDPVRILARVRSWLSERGRVVASVPNARSLHRQAAVSLGLLQFEEELNDLDRHHGHRRVYNPETFRRDFRAAGFTVETFGGYWIKPLSNQQLDSTWTDEMIQAFMQLGERYPDIAAEIYVVART
ncbi:MAG: class I SAM-dependent methyltransferase [Gemmatimonadaceae bacterium]